MPITEKQREARKKTLGSSDMAAVLGVSPWRSAYDVWLDKTGRVDGYAESPAMEAGELLEDAVLAYAEKRLGKIRRNQRRVSREAPLASSVDAILIHTGDPVEAKTSGLHGAYTAPYGDSGTDQVPDNVLIQAHVHMICCEAAICHIPTLLGGRGFNLFHVKREDRLVNIIIKGANDFWEKYVDKDNPPEHVEPSLDVLKAVKRSPGRSVKAPDPELIINYINAKERAKLAQKEEKEFQRLVLKDLQDAEEIYTEEFGAFTYFGHNRRTLDVERLRLELPEVYDNYCRETLVRSLRYRSPDKLLEAK